MTRVLIVDEDTATRVRMTAALGRGDFDVVSTTDARSAWRLLEEPEPPRIVVLGWTPHDPETQALVGRLRADARAHACWIVLTSASDAHEDRLAAFAEGADDYLVQPADAGELRARVTAAARLMARVESLEREVERLRFAA